jgi:hypothetical protein
LNALYGAAIENANVSVKNALYEGVLVVNCSMKVDDDGLALARSNLSATLYGDYDGDYDL